MIKHEYHIRVSYSDTDKMEVVHHSNYARYFENARWELFREIGIPYNKIEEMGYMLPVFIMNTTFLSPARYDDELRMVTVLKECRGVRMTFKFNIYNNKNVLVNESEIMLACVNSTDFKPCAIPAFITEAIQRYSFQHSS